MRPSSGSDGTTYHSVFEFSNTDGTKRQSMTSWSSDPPAHAVGDEVEVLYSSAGPGDVRLRSFTGLWFGAVLCAALTVMPLVMTFVFIWLVLFTIRRVWPTSPAIAP